MGRPINKKFFGNLNQPYNRVPQNDTGTGGEWITGTNVTSAGAYVGLLPTASATPDLNVESNTPATFLVHGKIVSASTTANGAGYTPDSVLTVQGGTYATSATIHVAQVDVVGASINTAGSNYSPGNVLTLSNSGNIQSTQITVDTVDGSGHILTFHVSRTGIASSTAGMGTNPHGVASGGGLGTRDFNLAWGVYSFGSPVISGDYTAVPTNPVSFSGGGGSGAQADVSWGVKSVNVVTTGSGYINAPSLAFSPSSGSPAVAVGILSITQNTSLKVSAWVPQLADNTPNTNGSAIYGDIVKQEASHRYYIDSNQGHGTCKLVAKATGSLAIGEMNLIATDYNSNTYYVTKLTNRLATLTQIPGGSNYVYNTEDRARWTIGAAVGTNKLLSTTKVSLASD